MTNYDHYLKKGNKILEKLTIQIDKNGYRENFGQKEARQFNDEVMKAFSIHELTYQEAVELSADMFQGVLDL